MKVKRNNYLFRRYLIMLIFIFLLHLVPFTFKESRLWGFNHLIFLPPAVTIGYILLGIFALSFPLLPVSVAWSDKFISWFSRLFFESPRRYLNRFGFVVLCGVFFILFPMPTHFLGDGYQYLSNIASGTGIFFKWSEKGITYILLAVQSLFGEKNLHSALMAFRVVSNLSGMAAIWFFFLITDQIASDKFHRLLVLTTLLFSGGLLLFFGYVENYSFLWVAVPGFVYFSLRYLNGASGLLPAAIFLLFGLIIHLLMAIFLPALIFLLFSRGRGAKIYQRNKWLLITAGGAISLGCLFFFIRQYSTNLYFENIFLPLFRSKPIDPSYALLSAPHLIDIGNLLLLLYPLLPLWIILPGGALRLLIKTPLGKFLLLATMGSLTFLFAIDPGLTMPRDWDLFSLSGFTLILFFLSRITDPNKIIKNLALPVVFISLLSTAPYLLTNLNADASVRYTENFASRDMKKSMGTWITLREYYKEQGDMKRAEFINNVINENFRNVNLMRDALAAVQHGDLSQSRRIIALIEPDKFSKNYHRLMAFYYLLERQPKPALQEAKDAVQVQPYSFDSYLLLAMCYQSLNMNDSAANVLHTAVSLNNGSIPILTALADLYMNQGKFDSSLLYCRKILAGDSTDANGQYLLTKSFWGKGMFAEARRNAEIYLAFARKDPLYDSRQKEFYELLQK